MVLRYTLWCMRTLHKEHTCIAPGHGQWCGDGWRGGRVELSGGGQGWSGEENEEHL